MIYSVRTIDENLMIKSEKENKHTWEESLHHNKRQSWNEERGQTQKKVLEKPW